VVSQNSYQNSRRGTYLCNSGWCCVYARGFPKARYSLPRGTQLTIAMISIVSDIENELSRS
jgi:hypothetical protein